MQQHCDVVLHIQRAQHASAYRRDTTHRARTSLSSKLNFGKAQQLECKENVKTNEDGLEAGMLEEVLLVLLSASLQVCSSTQYAIESA